MWLYPLRADPVGRLPPYNAGIVDLNSMDTPTNPVDAPVLPPTVGSHASGWPGRCPWDERQDGWCIRSTANYLGAGIMADAYYDPFGKGEAVIYQQHYLARDSMRCFLVLGGYCGSALDCHREFYECLLSGVGKARQSNRQLGSSNSPLRRISTACIYAYSEDCRT
jgi:hypothetical protein